MVRKLWKKYAWNHWLAVHAMRDMSEDTLSSTPLNVWAYPTSYCLVFLFEF